MTTDTGNTGKSNSFAFQDKLFARTTQFFALLVLVTLLGIIGSLIMGSWMTITQTGPKFLVTDVWDPVRSLFGGMAPVSYTHLDVYKRQSLAKATNWVPAKFSKRTPSKHAAR